MPLVVRKEVECLVYSVLEGVNCGVFGRTPGPIVGYLSVVGARRIRRRRDTLACYEHYDQM